MTVRNLGKGRLVVASDFDGTLLRHDISERILMRFAKRGWRRYDVLLAEGKVTLEECMKIQYGMIRAGSEQEMIDHIDRYCVFRAGVGRLVERCRKEDIELLVVSAGLDFTIRYAFEKNGMDTPRLVCPRSTLREDGGVGVTFPRFSSPGLNYKERLVSSRQAKGDYVVFMGNGMGDFAAATRADKVFAIRGSTLDRRCDRDGVRHESIDDFDEMLESGILPGAD